MKVTSVNIGARKTIEFNSQKVETGIFKHSTDEIILGKEDVEKDHVVDRKYHGGVDKACYVYGVNHYSYFQSKFPNADWSFGAFGENISLHELNEKEIIIGAQYQLGDALVEVASPRQPCFKLGVRIGNPMVIKDFMDYHASGIYLRVLRNGTVKTGDTMDLVSEPTDSVTVWEVHQLFAGDNSNKELAVKCFQNKFLAASFKEDLKKRYKL